MHNQMYENHLGHNSANPSKFHLELSKFDKFLMMGMGCEGKTQALRDSIVSSKMLGEPSSDNHEPKHNHPQD